MTQHEGPAAVLERLLGAVNAHDLDGLVSCFADDYLNETPAHPLRGFRGGAQVRTNWTQIFAGAPDLHATVPRSVVDGDRLWTEWDLAGTRPDGTALAMRGVVIFEVKPPLITSARFYLEPVEQTSGDVDVHTQRLTRADVSS
jgi:ketosteroid isomerase-like protein